MGDQLDNRPVFTIVMGCNGAGKSAWKRENWDRLPNPYFDQDSIAGGVGDWNSEASRERTRAFVDTEIAKTMAAREDFGIESTYSGSPGREMVELVRKAGYRVEGVYLGTASPTINTERVEHRVAANTGHWIDVKRLPQRHGFSLSNLRKTAEQFDELEIFDNSAHAEDRRPRPIPQLRLEKGIVKWQADPLEDWCAVWLERFERSFADRKPESPGGPPKPGPSGRNDDNPPTETPALLRPGTGLASETSDVADERPSTETHLAELNAQAAGDRDEAAKTRPDGIAR